MTREKTKNMILCSLFAALIVIGALIRVPVPVVPFTLQFLFTTLSGLLLGPRLGALSVCLYIAMGLAGFPVFAEGGGLSYVLKPSFGYMIGFAVGAYVTGTTSRSGQKQNFKRLFAACFAGLSAVYLIGMAYFYFISAVYLKNPIGLLPLFLYCFVAAVPGDIVLCAVAAFIGERVIPLVGNGGREQ